MSTTRDFDHLARAWLDEGPTELSDFALDAALKDVHLTRQRRAMRVPWRFPTMPAISRATAVAAVAVVAVVGAGGLLYLRGGSSGGPVTPSPSPALPTATAFVSAPTRAPISNPDGQLQPGTYTLYPLPAPDDSLAVTFTVPEGWGAVASSTLLSDRGAAIQFINVTTLNPDPCHWAGTADDISVGPEIADLVDALGSLTAVELSEPVDVTIGGWAGKEVDITAPTAPFSGKEADAPECDENVLRYWSDVRFGPTGVYVQGPANRWQTNVLDVDGTRLVVIAQDFPGMLASARAELDAVLESLVITP